jgi:hypothetical protein
MRRWIVFGCGAVFLGAAAWHFGKPTAPPVPAAPAVVAVVPAKAPKESPARIAEVIDLARAYEPVPEDAPPSGVDAATFIPVPDAPDRIPPAMDLDDPFAGLDRSAREMDMRPFWRRELPRERLDILPRDVTTPTEVLRNFRERENQHENPPRGWEIFMDRTERLDVLPREVLWPLRSGSGCFIPFFHGRLGFILEPESQDCRVVVRSFVDTTPSFAFTSWLTMNEPIAEWLDVMPREVRLEKLGVMPREVVVIQREEQERQTGVRDDDFFGLIGPK